MPKKSIYSPGQEALASLLRQIRERSGMTQTQVADRLGRPQSWIARCESGQRRIDVFELAAIARALDTDLRSVLDEIEDLLPRPRKR